MSRLPNKAKKVEAMLKHHGPMKPREVQMKVPKLSWVQTLLVLGENSQFAEDDSGRWHLTDEVNQKD